MTTMIYVMNDPSFDALTIWSSTSTTTPPLTLQQFTGMAARRNVTQDQAISYEIIDALEEGLKRLRKFDGRLYSPHSRSSFWFSTYVLHDNSSTKISKTLDTSQNPCRTEGKYGKRKLDDDATLEEYQYTLRR
jgi:hypothetical protein